MKKIEEHTFRLGIAEAQFSLVGLECELIRTADGSHTLRYRHDTVQHWTEPMHSSKGAWAETIHVYAPALSEALSRGATSKPIAIASIGLGLGYNELLTAAFALHEKWSPNDIVISSFESVSTIRSAFETKFRFGQGQSLPLPLNTAYEKILELLCCRFSLLKSELVQFVYELFAHNRFHLLGAVDKDTLAHLSLPTDRCNCIFFDAFSPKSSPDLWNEVLLHRLLQTLSAPNCIFASYASRTSLKKVLKAQGFTLKKVPGFAGKRECTFAIRRG